MENLPVSESLEEQANVLGSFEEVTVKEEIHVTDEDTTVEGEVGRPGPNLLGMEPPPLVPTQSPQDQHSLVGWLVMDPASNAAPGKGSTFIPAPKLTAKPPPPPAAPPQEPAARKHDQPSLILGPPQWLVPTAEGSKAGGGPRKGNGNTGSVQVTVNGKGFKEVRRVVTLPKPAATSPSGSTGSTAAVTTAATATTKPSAPAAGGTTERGFVKILPKTLPVVPVVLGAAAAPATAVNARPTTAPQPAAAAGPRMQLVHAQKALAPAAGVPSAPPPLLTTGQKILRFPGTAEQFLQLSKSGRFKGVAKPLGSLLQLATPARTAEAATAPASRGGVTGARSVSVVRGDAGGAGSGRLVLPASGAGGIRAATSSAVSTPVTVTSATRSSVTVAVSPTDLASLASAPAPRLARRGRPQRSDSATAPARIALCNCNAARKRRLADRTLPATDRLQGQADAPGSDLLALRQRLQKAEEQLAQQEKGLALERSVLENDRCALEVRRRLLELDREQLEAERAALGADDGPEGDLDHMRMLNRRSLEDELWALEERGRVLRARRRAAGGCEAHGQLLALAPATASQPPPLAVRGVRLRQCRADSGSRADAAPPALLELPLDRLPLAVSLEEGAEGEVIPLSNTGAGNGGNSDNDEEPQVVAVVARRSRSPDAVPLAQPARKLPRLAQPGQSPADRRKQKLVLSADDCVEVETDSDVDELALPPVPTPDSDCLIEEPTGPAPMAHYLCPLCGHKFGARGRFLRHLVLHHPRPRSSGTRSSPRRLHRHRLQLTQPLHSRSAESGLRLQAPLPRRQPRKQRATSVATAGQLSSDGCA